MKIHIKVRYDPRTRTFRLVDQDFRTILEGDAVYDLAIPLMLEEAEEVDELMPVSTGAMAHA